MHTRRLARIIVPLLMLHPAFAAADPAEAPLAPLYGRIAADLKQGKPLVVTVHVALCDNSVIHCGTRTMGNGDAPARNLYWGGAAGLKAYFDHARPWRRVLLDGGDGKVIIQRAVYRMRIKRPSSRWRKLGVTQGFDIYLVGLGYRGKLIAQANDAFIAQVMGEGGQKIRLPSGVEFRAGGGGHIVGYAGHNHLMDRRDYRFPTPTRTSPVGFFALACMTGQYMAKQLPGHERRALLLTRTLMYPGAFTIDGLIRQISLAAGQQQVFMGGVRYYARYQKRPVKAIRRAFIHDGDRRFSRLLK